ncbi:uncharacterized protein [Dermacentor albipictus]|uniref:uncharacterized protein n=1 Tax=Dermacentor albipictus TaxID=60249 RepID=UPI0038FC2F37
MQKLNLEKLRRSINAADILSLSVFFTVKPHKESVPFRAIVTEKGSWQGILSRYLQKHLSTIPLEDPFLLFSSVRSHVEDMAPVAFQNMTGLSTDNFSELISFYLSSTIITFNDSCFIQKEGVCIGSCLAPLLSDIFLASIDKRIQASLYNAGVEKAFRYVDDYLVYKPRSKKQILNYQPAHSKLVKRAKAKNCIRSALDKSCEHQVRDSVDAQLRRLEKAGFHGEIVASVVESQIREAKAVGDRCGVRVVFSASEKLGRMCRLVNESQKKSACKIKHTKALVECDVGVVYSIPLACGKCYIGQTGRCLNERLLEHRRNATSLSGAGHLADHIRRCSHKPAWKAFF